MTPTPIKPALKPENGLFRQVLNWHTASGYSLAILSTLLSILASQRFKITEIAITEAISSSLGRIQAERPLYAGRNQSGGDS